MIVGVTGDKLEVVYVQEKPAPKCTAPLHVAMSSSFGLNFPLTKDSYFTGYQVIRDKMVDKVCRTSDRRSEPLLCPWSKYPALEVIATERKRQLVQSQAVLAKAKAYRAAHPVGDVLTPAPSADNPPVSPPVDPASTDDDVE